MGKEHPVDVGLRHEALIVSELLRRGLHVLLPHGLNDRFVRVQCKSARLMSGAVTFKTVSVRSNRRQTLRRRYVGEIEFFMAYCPSTDDIYVVSIDEAPMAEVTLRLTPPANNQVARVRMARDHLLDVALATTLRPAPPRLEPLPE
jgi:hypothetical protein